MLIIAHRGFSSRQPEMTRAAYREAIAWSRRTATPLALECDVHFSADDELICLHDLSIDRTSTRTGQAADFSVAQLKGIDFGSRRVEDPTDEQRELVTLEELLAMVLAARTAGVPVSLVIETKHPSPRGDEIEPRVAAMLRRYGWDTAGAPVQLISFCPDALDRFGELLPAIDRTLLLRRDFGGWRDGHLPDGVRVVGVDLRLLRTDPAYVERVRGRGHQVHVWTVNTPQDILWCRGLGVHALTTDCPDRVDRLLNGRRRGLVAV